MPFNAKVKTTGELFEATSEENSSRNVDDREEGKSYSGFLYAGHFDPTKKKDGVTVFKCTKERKQAIFSADELEKEKVALSLKIEFIYKKAKKTD